MSDFDEDEEVLKFLRRVCPYYLAYVADPPIRGLMGKHGPETCIEGCWEEPVCVTG